jgi:hypothetical protein
MYFRALAASCSSSVDTAPLLAILLRTAMERRARAGGAARDCRDKGRTNNKGEHIKSTRTPTNHPGN